MNVVVENGSCRVQQVAQTTSGFFGEHRHHFVEQTIPRSSRYHERKQLSITDNEYFTVRKKHVWMMKFILPTRTTVK